MQSKWTKRHHAERTYWERVETALTEQYHRDAETAMDWAADAREKCEDAWVYGMPEIPDTPPSRMAQEIFMERCDE